MVEVVVAEEAFSRVEEATSTSVEVVVEEGSIITEVAVVDLIVTSSREASTTNVVVVQVVVTIKFQVIRVDSMINKVVSTTAGEVTEAFRTMAEMLEEERDGTKATRVTRVTKARTRVWATKARTREVIMRMMIRVTTRGDLREDLRPREDKAKVYREEGLTRVDMEERRVKEDMNREVISSRASTSRISSSTRVIRTRLPQEDSTRIIRTRTRASNKTKEVTRTTVEEAGVAREEEASREDEAEAVEELLLLDPLPLRTRTSSLTRTTVSPRAGQSRVAIKLRITVVT